jgi:iron(III) transport system substrate-binding protein
MRARNVPAPLVAAALLAALLPTLLAGCGSAAGDGPAEDELVVYSGRNKNLVGPILERFAKDTDIKIFVRYGETAELAAQLLEEGDRTPADVFLSQDAGALGALSTAGRLAELPDQTLNRVPDRFRAHDGTWVGLSGRARVIAYDPRQVPEAQVPGSVFDVTAARWKGKVGIAPTNASFQAFVTGMRVLAGADRTRTWLDQLVSNDVQTYNNNVAVLDAVDRGEIALGLINHYYWYEKVAEVGKDKVRARIAFLDQDDPGALVNVAGTGLLAGSDKGTQGLQLVDYLLSADAQRYFAEETKEYPLIDGVSPAGALPPLARVGGPRIDLSRLDTLRETLSLLDEVGLT